MTYDVTGDCSKCGRNVRVTVSHPDCGRDMANHEHGHCFGHCFEGDLTVTERREPCETPASARRRR